MMDISKITGADKILNTNKTRPVQKAHNESKKDEVNLSSEAKRIAELQRTIDIIKTSPDVRADKIEHARKLIESGEYKSRNVIEKVADQLLDSLGK